MEGLPAGVEVLEASGEVGPSFDELVKTPTVGFRKASDRSHRGPWGCRRYHSDCRCLQRSYAAGAPQVFVETHFDAISIDDLELSSDDESTLESRLGVTDSPGDIVWNTVGFQIPWGEMDAAMRDAPGGDRNMPEAWYSGRIDVLDIVVEGKRIDGVEHRPSSCKRCQHDGHFVKT